ncbi:DUF1310 family protein [Streptococcus suis]|uniref:DUF1310 family protein n=1 Tax=Streptococcus suis TaxID=1307 RepID=UPI000943E9D7|nr:DUF1310 family protein [Streptococcus suis]MBO8052797.1 DUF1310 family protein [Streptococcus suis]MBS8064395.1 DUF1310 family protein [Streptococcus suis]MCB2917069.1 DUF1310 family protein [Streptococcus suis]MCB2919022.1 DUF1310 family protein [Streptococcus suis]MCB2925029.1 DUF1310 family protein [Streptococcus suis]
MKKVMKVIIGILLVIGIGIGGIKLMQKIEHDQMVEIVKSEEVREIVEEQLKYLDNEALSEDGLIKTYEIDDSSIIHSPMGGMIVRVYVNGDEDFGFHFNLLQNEDGKFKSGSYVIKSKLADLLGK